MYSTQSDEINITRVITDASGRTSLCDLNRVKTPVVDFIGVVAVLLEQPVVYTTFLIHTLPPVFFVKSGIFS